MSTAEQATSDEDESARPARAIARRAGLVKVFPHRADLAPDGWRVTSPCTLGRGREADLRLQDGRISRTHAIVEPRPGGFLVRDQASRHGTYVDGVRVGGSGALARIGSFVRVGDTILLVTADVDRQMSAPRRITGARLGLPRDVMAGPTLADVWDQAIRVAALPEPVTILGDTGSGKECVARIIHAYAKGQGPFVGINVAAIPDALFEAELFGYERGAFTGASAARLGAFREAADGVLFLDEVGDLRPDLQVKLLRAIDLGQVRPLGANRDVPITARVVCATSRPLDAPDASTSFRADLWYRLSGIVIRVPALRERPEDILLLAHGLLAEKQGAFTLAADAAEKLLLGTWEGNARQLRHALVRAMDAVSREGRGEVRARDLEGAVPEGGSRELGAGPLTAARIRMALLETDGVVSRAAERLGVSRTTFYSAVKRLKIARSTED